MRSEHARGWESRELVLVPAVEFDLEEPDALVGATMAQRVVAVGRRVRGTLQRREGERLEPGGAGLGEAREDHVGGPWHEAGMDGWQALLRYELGQPEAAGVTAEREWWPPGLEGRRRRDDPNYVGVRRHHQCRAFLCVILWLSGIHRACYRYGFHETSLAVCVQFACCGLHVDVSVPQKRCNNKTCTGNLRYSSVDNKNMTRKSKHRPRNEI